MVFHLGFELPERQTLDADTEELTPHETQIIQRQIRKNTAVIDSYIERIHLFVNQEKYPKGEVFIEKLRRRMFLLMEENDTFRRLLWRHIQGKTASSVKIAG